MFKLKKGKMAKKLGQEKRERSKSTITHKTKEELFNIRKQMMKPKALPTTLGKKKLKSKTAMKGKKIISPQKENITPNRRTKKNKAPSKKLLHHLTGKSWPK